MAKISSAQKVKQYSRARLARDARFDGLFFTAVKTTGIYCRPICPATPPKESNVEYHDSSISASEAGFRPCLRCHPDAAPNSHAWIGVETTFRRAVTLIEQGALQDANLELLSERLGISSRYLRELFNKHLGTSPKNFALHKQCLFAKQLLHQSNLSITDIAFASGFNSVRRFNEAMQERLTLTPSQIRKKETASHSDALQLRLSYRPPFQWKKFLSFLQARLIPGLEWASASSYGRTIQMGAAHGWFEIEPLEANNQLLVTLEINDLSYLPKIIQRLRVVLDLDAPIELIDQHLSRVFGDQFSPLMGLRIPGVWAGFESGIRGILGQQVSVKQAHDLVTCLVHELGEPTRFDHQQGKYFFPQPDAVANSELVFFRMPQARKDTLRRLAEYVIQNPNQVDYDAWLDIKGIGPWTVNYVKLRAAKDPDVWLAGDAGVKNALKLFNQPLDSDEAAPWRSYLVFQLWNLLQSDE